MTQPVTSINGPIKALFSDLDGTMTSEGRLLPETYNALCRLAASGMPVVVVTGRPAGWGQAVAALWPVSAVVTENGGVTFIPDGHRLRKVYGVPEASLPDWRRKMRDAAVDAMQEVPSARLSSDSKYREVDLAIDWNEEIHIPVEQADVVVEKLRKGGFTATRSSVHVNFSPPKFNKLSACQTVIEQVFKGDPNAMDDYVYVGDALNDAPMFGGFKHSVGVANVKRWWDDLAHKPNFMTESPEGAGFQELVAHLMTVR